MPDPSSPRKHAPKGPLKTKGDPISKGDPIRGRCTARAKHSMNPCKYPAIPGGTVCRFHGGKAPQVIAKAEDRLRALQAKAIGAIDELIDQTQFPSTRYAAARDVLDRTMGKPSEQVNVDMQAQITVTHVLPE